MRCFGMLMDGRAPTSGIRRPGKEATLLMVVNDHTDVVEFTLPEPVGGNTWSLLLDTNIDDNSEKGDFRHGQKFAVTSRSVLLFGLRVDRIEPPLAPQ